MPSDRATRVAKYGPHAAVLAAAGILLLLAAGAAAWTPVRAAVRVVAPGLFLLLAAGFAYQGLFMIAYPSTAVAESIRPPLTVKQRALGLRSLVTPDTALQARLIGLLGLLGAAFGVGLALLFALTPTGA